MSDLIKQLRRMGGINCTEAADRIEELGAELAMVTADCAVYKAERNIVLEGLQEAEAELAEKRFVVRVYEEGIDKCLEDYAAKNLRGFVKATLLGMAIEQALKDET